MHDTSQCQLDTGDHILRRDQGVCRVVAKSSFVSVRPALTPGNIAVEQRGLGIDLGGDDLRSRFRAWMIWEERLLIFPEKLGGLSKFGLGG